MRSESNGHGNSFANGASVNNGQPVRPPGTASIWDHLEPPLPV